MPSPKLRVARPTDNLQAIIRFYEDGLGLGYIGGFTDHDGFDGVMLGDRFGSYHFEFTHSAHPAGRAPSQDHLLVFYLADEELWRSSVTRMKNCGYQPVPSLNPYWDRHGVTFEDPDGYRVVLQNGDWPRST